MQTILYLIMAIIAGFLIPLQSGLNAELCKSVKSPVLGAALSFLVGFAGLLLYALVSRTDFSHIKNAGSLPWYYWTGGLMGAFFVLTLIIAPPKIGMALTLAITIAAQILFGMVIDHFGWLGMPQQSISWTKITGLLLIIAGSWMLK